MSHPLTHLDISTQITIHGSTGKEENPEISDFRSKTERALRQLLHSRDVPLGIYIHVPFCFHKCHYCDFYSIVDNRDRQAAFTNRLIDEIQAVGRLLADSSGAARRPTSIFIGGGTPTLLAVEYWQPILDAIGRHLTPQADAEFTVEANPETVTFDLAECLIGGGVNRISVGAQSFHVDHLKTLERWHDPANVERSVRILRDSGINAINLDLIFGIPGQTVEQWRDDLMQALVLEPTHLSCYGLMYEPNTPLTKRLQMGKVTPVDDEVEAQMYEATCELLHAAGFQHYEISAWALPGRQCRHNLIYWRNQDWMPIGPSASGHLAGVRWKNVPRLGEYLEGRALPPTCDVEHVDHDGQVGETLMLGLRLIDGISLDDVDRMLALGNRGEERSRTIESHIQSGQLERENGRLRLTASGLLVADTVISELL